MKRGLEGALPEGKRARAEAAADRRPFAPRFRACRQVDTYEKLNRVQEGAYGVVHRARDRRSGAIVALKKFKVGGGDGSSFPLSALREIGSLRRCAGHENVLELLGVATNEARTSFYLVMPFLPHDLKDLMLHMSAPFRESEAKSLLLQLLRGLAHLHAHWVVHRDVKTSNLLLSASGVLKLADFGLARQFGDPPEPLTPGVVTLHYRAPELLLGVDHYGPPVDLWSAGCIFAELLTNRPLFSASSEMELLGQMAAMLGAPNDAVWPGVSARPAFSVLPLRHVAAGRLRAEYASRTTALGLQLLEGLLTYDPRRRLSSEAALRHGYFDELPRPRPAHLIQSFPSLHEGRPAVPSHR